MVLSDTLDRQNRKPPSATGVIRGDDCRSAAIVGHNSMPVLNRPYVSIS